MRFYKLLLVCVAITASIAACDLMAQPIYRNPANEQGDYLQTYIDEAAWAWGQRTGMNVTAVDTTAAHCVEGRITVASFTREEYAAHNLSQTAAAVVWDCGTGRLIVINPSRLAWSSLMQHEIGHALGFWEHSFDQFDVMHPSARMGSRITTTDVLNVLKTPAWPVVRPPSLCHIEIDHNFDMVIPEINGLRVVAGYLGVVGGYHEWVLLLSGRQPDMQGCTNATVANGTVTLTDIRSRRANYSRATFQHVSGNTWRLVELLW